MEVTTDVTILDRLLIAANVKNDSELSRILCLSSQAVSKARTTQKIPAIWVPKIALQFKVSADWLYFGRGSMLLGEHPVPPIETHPSLDSCTKCAVLEAENKLLQEFKTLQDETIKAQAETITMYKRALEAAQQEHFKGDHGITVVPPSARSVRNNTEINK